MIELKSGILTMLRDDEPVCEFNNINGFVESEIEPYSFGQEVLKFNHEATFEAEMTDCSPLKIHMEDLSFRPFNIEYRTPIMVQSRWHKKPRINKKWLKRYGMKKDYIVTKCNVISMTSDYECENPYEIEHKFNLSLDSMKYEFRPDQLRKNLKMEMCYG